MGFFKSPLSFCLCKQVCFGLVGRYILKFGLVDIIYDSPDMADVRLYLIRHAKALPGAVMIYVLFIKITLFTPRMPQGVN